MKEVATGSEVTSCQGAKIVLRMKKDQGRSDSLRPLLRVYSSQRDILSNKCFGPLERASNLNIRKNASHR